MPSLSLNGKPIHSDTDLIILDKDGTLIDIHHYWASMIRIRARKAVDRWLASDPRKEEAFAFLTDAMGICPKTSRMKRQGPVGVKPRTFIVETVRAALETFGVKKTKEEIELLFQEVDAETAKDLRPLLKVLPGVTDFLSNCRESGVRLAVVTTDITHRAEAAFKALGLHSFFELILGGDQVPKNKPAPDPAFIAMEKLSTKADQTVVIGDHPVDIEMGRSGGIGCNIAVLGGLGEAEDFSQCHIMSSFSELRVSP